jgi:hypothetical protein
MDNNHLKRKRQNECRKCCSVSIGIKKYKIPYFEYVEPIQQTIFNTRFIEIPDFGWTKPFEPIAPIEPLKKARKY